MNFKVSVVEWTRKNKASLRAASREFNVDRKRVRDWTQKYDELKGKCAGAPGKRRKLSTGRPPISTDLDQRVLEFLEEEEVKVAQFRTPACRLKWLKLQED